MSQVTVKRVTIDEDTNGDDVATEQRDDRNRSEQGKTPAFTTRVVIEMKLDFATALGYHILDNGSKNTALMALAHELVGD